MLWIKLCKVLIPRWTRRTSVGKKYIYSKVNYFITSLYVFVQVIVLKVMKSKMFTVL